MFMKKASSIFTKLVYTLLEFSLMLATVLGICFNWESASTYSNSLKIDFLIFIQIIFVLLALIQIISFYINKIDLKKEIIISAMLFILAMILYILHESTIQFLVCILLILVLIIIDKKYLA
ncbi:hypothetical protein RZ70_00070 [Apilactobacillus kunkeei]|nr:hypothetical protein RZ70_00070 [Apilactobacillus kunkeei]CAI2683020.1 hypothetical protein AKUH4B504J_09520 [Apilactobacillus kunkeei]